MHAEYCDVPYSWDKDFESSDKVKVLVIGDSFGRDWANILNESSIADQIEISYIFPRSEEVYIKNKNRLLEADVVFRAISIPKSDIIGYKNYGSSNGIIYSHRNSEDYFEQAITLDDTVLRNNQKLSDIYGEHYINMIGAVQNEDGSVRVFTDDHYFISQDCRHLTQYGAQYYARIIDLSWIIKKKR